MNQRSKKGFTLVELIIGIVVLAIAMMIMNTLLISQSKDALAPLYRLRSVELGKGIIEGVLLHDYEDADGDTTDDYDDVNDFEVSTFTKVVGNSTLNQIFGNSFSSQYSNYTFQILISSDTTKKIVVTINTPSDESIIFSALKGSYQ